MNPARPSLAVRALTFLAHAVFRFPRGFLYPQLALFFLSVFWTVEHLQFDMNRNDLVGKEKQYHRNYLRYREEFPAQDDLVAVAESNDTEKNRQFVERLGARLEKETNTFTDVFYKGDLKMMGSKALLFITNETTLAEMLQRLQEVRPMLQNFTRVTNLNSLFRQVNRQFRAAARETNPNTDALVNALPVLERIATLASDAIQRPGTPPSPGVTAMFDSRAPPGGTLPADEVAPPGTGLKLDTGEEAEQNLYITFAHNRIYLVTARALREELNEKAVLRLRELVNETQAEVPGLQVGITGEPVLEVDEMAQSKRDTTVATIVSLGICALLFIYGYRETGRPLKATLCLIVGLGYTLGFTTLAIGHLNLLTITFLPILIGLAIDFGIHLVTRYEEELRQGRTEHEAMTKALVNTGLGIFTGCLTTAGAFLAMSLTNFKGIQEMGLISGCGLVICLVPMMTLLPVLLLRGRQNVLDHQAHAAIERRARIERLWLERPGLLAGITFTITGLAFTQLPKVRFDYNLLHMQSAGLPAVMLEHKLINGASKSVIFGVVITNSLTGAAHLQSRLERLPTVAGVDSMASFLGGDPSNRLALIRRIRNQLADFEFAPLDTRPIDPKELRDTLMASQAYFGLGASAAAKEGKTALARELSSLHDAVHALRQRLARSDANEVVRKLSAFQQALFTDLRETMAAIKNQDDTAPLKVEDLPVALCHRFVGRSGTNYLLQVNPKSNVWDRANQEAFVRDLRSVDPAATGTPVQLYEYTTLLKDSYIQAAWYALGAIAVLVLVHFRQPSCVVLALLPVALGTIWTMGWMGWRDIPFNPANIMTLPLVIGVGVTNGIHILNRFAEEQTPSILARSTGKAVLLSALTTVAGFGSLIPAKHQGIASLGMVMAFGTAACMIAGLTFLPTLLNWLVARGWRMATHAGSPPHE